MQCPILGHISLDKTIWLLLTLSSALTVAALPPNALASLCLRNLAHLGHPSPKPTSPWTLLPPSLHSLMRAASGRTPPPLPGIAVARQPRVRYPASLGFGGWEGAVWDKTQAGDSVEQWDCFPRHPHRLLFLLGPGRAVSPTSCSFVFWGRWESELRSHPTLAHEHLMAVGSNPSNMIKPKEMDDTLPSPCRPLSTSDASSLLFLFCLWLDLTGSPGP